MTLGQSIVHSLETHPDDWTCDEHRLVNSGTSVWIANGMAFYRVTSLNSGAINLSLTDKFRFDRAFHRWKTRRIQRCLEKGSARG